MVLPEYNLIMAIAKAAGYFLPGINTYMEGIVLINKMKMGYKEMAEINLEYSKLGSEYMLDDVNEYEAWICGV